MSTSTTNTSEGQASSQPLIIDVVMGGPGPEAVISRRSGTAVADALTANGHDVATIDCTQTLDNFIASWCRRGESHSWHLR